MSIIFDILAVVIILACALTSLKQGALASFIKSVSPILSGIAAFSGAKSVGVHFEPMAKKIAPESEFLHEIIQFALAFIVIFALAMLILFLIRMIFSWLNTLVDKFPGFGTANKIINVVLGLLIGYFNANFFIYILRGIGIIAVDSIEPALADSVICKFIGEHSIFESVVEMIAGLFA